MNILLYAVPAAAAVALLFAFIKARGIARHDEGEPGMAEIARAISEGADAFLKSEYKLLLIFIAIVFAGIWLGLGSITTAGAFLVGALFSVLAGYFGMKVATRANVRTANAARTGGINEALRVAFSGGTVMGMCVVGLGLIGASILYIITENGDVLTGFSLGASSVALFARVGGGIYTKAADVGADLVGKVEAGIPEDDPRNVIADNVGDNVGDVAGMGADLFESYVGSIVSAIVLGVFSYGATGAVYPLALSGLGIIASVLGTFFVRGGKNADPMKALKMGSYTSAILVAAGAKLCMLRQRKHQPCNNLRPYSRPCDRLLHRGLHLR